MGRGRGRERTEGGGGGLAEKGTHLTGLSEKCLHCLVISSVERLDSSQWQRGTTND